MAIVAKPFYNMKVGIIGQGFVGSAVYQKIKQFHTVLTYDIITELSNSSYSDLVKNCEIIFICLPTPMNKDGSCNLDIVKKVLAKLNNETKAIIVNKSTVVPGSTKEFNNLFKNLKIVFNPEFLTERNAVEDFNNQNRIILGGPKSAVQKLKFFYSNIFPDATIVGTSSKYAEMTKYLTNSFLASKVSFANEMYEMCNKLNLDYNLLLEYSLLDKRLGKSHWSVPGPDGDFGFGGRCFPKDLSAIIKLSEKIGSNNILLKAVKKSNLIVKSKN